MPKLGNTTKRLTMPSDTADDPAWIDVKTALYPLDVIDLVDKLQDEQYKTICAVATRAIVGWNYTDLDGNPVEATVERIDQLPSDDKKFLFENINEMLTTSFEGLNTDEKKTSSEPSEVTEPLTFPSPPII